MTRAGLLDLPEEVLELVFHHADRDTALALARVARRLLPISRRFLVYAVGLRSPEQTAKLGKLLKRIPTLRFCVYSVSVLTSFAYKEVRLVCLFIYPCLMQCFQQTRNHCFGADSIVAVLRLLTGLRHLCLPINYFVQTLVAVLWTLPTIVDLQVVNQRQRILNAAEIVPAYSELIDVIVALPNLIYFRMAVSGAFRLREKLDLPYPRKLSHVSFDAANCWPSLVMWLSGSPALQQLHLFGESISMRTAWRMVDISQAMAPTPIYHHSQRRELYQMHVVDMKMYTALFLRFAPYDLSVSYCIVQLWHGRTDRILLPVVLRLLEVSMEVNAPLFPFEGENILAQLTDIVQDLIGAKEPHRHIALRYIDLSALETDWSTDQWAADLPALQAVCKKRGTVLYL